MCKLTRVHSRCAQVSALGALIGALTVEVADARQQHKRALESRTLIGHVKNLAGYVLSVYCILR